MPARGTSGGPPRVPSARWRTRRIPTGARRRRRTSRRRAGDHRARLNALATGLTRVRVTKTAYLQLFVGATAAGVWVMIAGIPIAEETGRPPDWWYLGLGLSIVAGVALREPFTGLLIRLFA